jgi:hypothetical protein
MNVNGNKKILTICISVPNKRQKNNRRQESTQDSSDTIVKMDYFGAQMRLTHEQHIVGPPSSCLERMSPTDVADKWFDPVLKSFRMITQVIEGTVIEIIGPTSMYIAVV